MPGGLRDRNGNARETSSTTNIDGPQRRTRVMGLLQISGNAAQRIPQMFFPEILWRRNPGEIQLAVAQENFLVKPLE